MLLKLGLLIFYSNSSHLSKDVEDNLRSAENFVTIPNENTSSSVDLNGSLFFFFKQKNLQ